MAISAGVSWRTQAAINSILADRALVAATAVEVSTTWDRSTRGA
jgi:hypothetical protein